VPRFEWRVIAIEMWTDMHRIVASSSLETNIAQMISLYDVICQCLVNRCWFVACYVCVQRTNITVLPRHKEQLSVIWPHAWEQPARINRTVAMETHPVLFVHYPRSHTTYHIPNCVMYSSSRYEHSKKLMKLVLDSLYLLTEIHCLSNLSIDFYCIM
jgi:hypothetical protein